MKPNRTSQCGPGSRLNMLRPCCLIMKAEQLQGAYLCIIVSVKQRWTPQERVQSSGLRLKWANWHSEFTILNSQVQKHSLFLWLNSLYISVYDEHEKTLEENISRNWVYSVIIITVCTVVASVSKLKYVLLDLWKSAHSFTLSASQCQLNKTMVCFYICTECTQHFI